MHTLIVSLHKGEDLLMIYIKHRKENEVSYRTEFCGIVELTTRCGQSIAEAVVQFYSRHELDLQRMVMLTSEDDSIVLGKPDAAAALLKQQIPHLKEQHCMIYGKDRALDDVWENVLLMRNVDSLLKALATVARRSATASPEVLARLAPRPPGDFEPKWLNRYRAMLTVQKYGLEGHGVHRTSKDCLAKHCLKWMGELQPVLQTLLKVLGWVVELDDRLERCDLTLMDGQEMANDTVEEQGDRYWSDKSEQIEKAGHNEWNWVDDDVSSFTSSVNTKLFNHFFYGSIYYRIECKAFDPETLRQNISYDYDGFGSTCIAALAQRYEAILRPQSMDAIILEYDDFKCMVKEQLQQRTISSFSDVVAATLG